jgi:hypothetical protein
MEVDTWPSLLECFSPRRSEKLPPLPSNSAHGVLEEGRQLVMALFYFKQRTPEARDLDRDRGVFEIAFDPRSRITATFVSPKFNPVGSERWESKSEHLTLRL